MASSDSMFLFEIAVEELKSFTTAGNYRLRIKFGDVFTLKLRDPNELYAESILCRGRKSKKQHRAKYGKSASQTLPPPTGQSVLVASDIESLVSNMMKYPIELTLFSKDDPYMLGIVEIPWSPVHVDYVKNTATNPNQPPAIVTDNYKLFDDYISKRVAVVTLKVKLSKLNNQTLVQPRYVMEDPLEDNSIRDLNPEFAKALTTTRVYNNDSLEDTGIIKTIYSGKKKPKKTGRVKRKVKSDTKPKPVYSDPQSTADEINVIKDIDEHNDIMSLEESVKDTNLEADIIGRRSLMVNSHRDNSIASLVRSQTHIGKPNRAIIGTTRHWSSTSLEIKERLDTLNYIFGNLDGPFGNQVYCVGYFTVETDAGLGAGSPSQKSSPAASNQLASPNTKTPSPNKSQTPTKASAPSTPTEGKVSDSSLKGKGKYSFKICGSQCKMGTSNPCFENICSIDLPEEAAHLISMRKCTETVICDHRRDRTNLSSSDEPIIMDFTQRNLKDCCITQEELAGEVTTKMKMNDDPCFCTCECTFGFIKKTTYCGICGGYEMVGDEMVGTRGDQPFPCPIYHNLVEKGKKTPSAAMTSSAREIINNKRQTVTEGDTAAKTTKSRPVTPEKRSSERRSVEKSIESEKDLSKKGKKKCRKDDSRFKFNYGYKGIPPKIGHSQCAMPCTGNLLPVPKRMGWLWTADNIPGLKVRPNWRPGAANKHVVRMLKIARYPEQEISKRRKKDTGKKKRPLKRPLLIVRKTDGEYTVTMETMRSFNKPRAINQYPYEDKPLVTYTVGRTDEENRERQKRKERQKRRLEREQRQFIQSAFHDMCKEICIKTYQQALGILPYAEDPPCPCYPLEAGRDRVDVSHSCSCTESTRSSGSATDDDEWTVKFTPPVAYFNPAYVTKKVVKVDNSTQYTYLDYKVKLLDRFGNPVPRFFIGPDGKQECSDLGGFWGPDKKWLEINVDGYVCPDGRWAPIQFIGPCGEQVEAEGGKFQATNGVWLVVGIDGFVNSQGKWCFYPKPRTGSKDPKKHRSVEAWKKAGGCKEAGDEKGKKGGKFVVHGKPSEATWSCFGDASPKTLSQMGIIGHGHDRRLLLSTLEKMMAQGENVKMPHTPQIPKMQRKKGKKIQSTSSHHHFTDRTKCKHSPPSDKGIVAMDETGRKTYFRLKNFKNPRPRQRITTLGETGISLSSFHVPCFSSFINSEAARQEKYGHILQHNARVMASTGAQTL